MRYLILRWAVWLLNIQLKCFLLYHWKLVVTPSCHVKLYRYDLLTSQPRVTYLSGLFD